MKKIIFLSLITILLTPNVVLAAICFLPDCEDKIEKESPTMSGADACEKAGFKYYSALKCPEYTHQYNCPYPAAGYFKCDAKVWCKNNGYNTSPSSCSSTQIPTDKCPSAELYKECADIAELCRKENPSFTNTCPDGYSLDPNQRCSIDASYGICCNLCAGYDQTSASPPSGYVLDGTCVSCNGTKYKYLALDCPPGYSINVTSCSSGSFLSTSGTNKKCGKCIRAREVCEYWNANGEFVVKTGCRWYQGYGADATVYIPSQGTTVNRAIHSWWRSSTVEGGPLNVTEYIWIGMDNNLATAHTVFNVPVTIRGRVVLGKASTVKFNAGISGNYYCTRIDTWDAGEKTIPCPF